MPDAAGGLSAVTSHFQQYFSSQINSLFGERDGALRLQPFRKVIEASLGFVEFVLRAAYF